MTTALRILPVRLAAVALAAASVATLPAPAFAQDTTAEARLRKIEAEVRALQRKVFPGGDARFFEPQIGAPGDPAPAAPTTGASAPSTTAVTDILVRLDALEAQLQRLTARSEEQANALSLLEGRIAALEADGTAPTGELPPLPTAASAQSNLAAMSGGTAPAPSTPAPTPAAPATTPPPPVAAPSAARLAAVQAIAKPQTADAGDDEYSYGFRLWNAGFYPEARQQLTKFVEQYPNHPRISFGRNLLGRAFLDDNMPDEAGKWFLKNYLTDKAGDRAPDSLLYLAKAQIALKETRKACIALAEFAQNYPLVAAGRLADEYKANLSQVTCS